MSKKIENYDERYNNVRRKYELTSFSLAETLVFATIFGIAIIATLTVIGALFFSHSVGLIIGILMAVSAFIGGFVKVPTAHIGVIEVFGKRRFQKRFDQSQKSLLGEGWSWIFRPFMSAIPISTEIMDIETIGVHLVSNNKGTAIDDPNNEFDEKKGGVSFRVSASTVVIVNDPIRLLSAGIESVGNELVDATDSAIRRHAAQSTPGRFPDENDKLEKEILASATAETQSSSWGVLILAANVTGIKHTNSETLTVYESFYKEQLESKSEVEEAKTTLEIVEMFVNAGLPAQDAFKYAAAQQELLNHSAFTFSGGTSGGNQNDILIALAEKYLTNKGGEK